MHEISAATVADYLRTSGRATAAEPIEARELSGGVSNVVLLVELSSRGERFVVKQARGKLRVQEEWLCPIERIWREVETLQICGELLKALPQSAIRNPQSAMMSPPSIVAAFQSGVPSVLWEDRTNYCFAMTAAPAGHKTWKELLLAGELPLSLGIATGCGEMLAALHAGSWGNAEIAARLDDRQFFDQLRIDPYYRHVAKVHPDLAPQLQQLIDSVWSHRRCLVHGDFSPKNLLVWQGQTMLIDFEVGHYGDPAFDLGFFLTHLVLKAIWSGARRERYLGLATAFWNTYRLRMEQSVSPAEIDDLESRAMFNLAGCLLARIDGKSPVEYLGDTQRQAVRERGRQWLMRPPSTWTDTADSLSPEY
ncbi:MAG TPA: phosphotransferase [Pirellulaceae bacterium]|nr:phosphotransferase [Pirellulaceae bacterium]